MTTPIIFVGGIHGAGKSTFGRRVAESLGIGHVAASTLIREAALAAEEDAPLAAGKAVANVDENQQRLIIGLTSYLRSKEHDSLPLSGLILDGHFSVIDSSNRVSEISPKVFASLGIRAILLVEVDPKAAFERLLNRDGGAPPIELLTALASSEARHADFVAASLDVPVYRVSGEVDMEVSARTAAVQLQPHVRGAH